MKKRVYLLLLLLPAVLIFSGCGKKVENNKISPVVENPAVQTNVAAENEKSDTTKTSASVKEMLKSGKSLECTFSSTDTGQGATQSGKMYVDGAKARIRTETEVITNSTGVKSEAYMITDGNYGYSWSSIDPKAGIKFNLNESSSVNSTDKSGQNTEDLDQKIDFDCHNWSVDNSKFDLPAGVKFTDFDQMMKSIPTNTTTIDPCSICKQTTDAAIKAACQNLNCK